MIMLTVIPIAAPINVWDLLGTNPIIEISNIPANIEVYIDPKNIDMLYIYVIEILFCIYT